MQEPKARHAGPFPPTVAADPPQPVTAESLREAYPDYVIKQSGIGRWWASPSFPVTGAHLASGIALAVVADDLETLADILFGQALRRQRHGERERSGGAQ